MKRDLFQYQRALFLRIKKGYSYNEIREEVPVAKSTLSLWLRDIELTESQRRRIEQTRLEKLRKGWGAHNLGEWNRKRRQKQVTEIRVKAKEEMVQINDREFFVAGIMLYWAEGSKGGKDVRVSNSDQIFVQFMMRWFRECCHIPEDHFRASLHYHEGQDELKNA